MFPLENLPDFIWDEVNLEKIALHDVEPYEVEEVFTDSKAKPRSKRQNCSEQRFKTLHHHWQSLQR